MIAVIRKESRLHGVHKLLLWGQGVLSMYLKERGAVYSQRRDAETGSYPRCQDSGSVGVSSFDSASEY
jgi:hypothetical protein